MLLSKPTDPKTTPKPPLQPSVGVVLRVFWVGLERGLGWVCNGLSGEGRGLGVDMESKRQVKVEGLE